MFKDHGRGWFTPRRFHVFGRCGEILLGYLGFLSGVMHGSNFFLPFIPRTRVLDRDDERRAQRLRQALGLRRCLVSWELQRDGQWKARLSGPGLVITIERTARGRCRAIRHAERAMNRVLASRSALEMERPHKDVPPPKA